MWAEVKEECSSLISKKLVRKLYGLLYLILRDVIRSESTPFNIMDSLGHLLLVPFARACQGLYKAYCKRREYRVAKYIEKKYGVRFVYERFPFDIFWRDYFQKSDFLPSDGGVVIDIGANIGDFAVVIAKLCKINKVIAIEPEPDAFRYLLENVRINGLKDIILPFNFAVWEFDGKISLCRSGSYLTTFVGKVSQESVCRTLDSLMKELYLDKIDLLKIDVEGSELEVLKGSENLLNTIRPKIVVEVHSRRIREWTINFLHRYGYRPAYEKVNNYEPLTSVLYFAPRSKLSTRLT